MNSFISILILIGSFAFQNGKDKSTIKIGTTPIIVYESPSSVESLEANFNKIINDSLSGLSVTDISKPGYMLLTTKKKRACYVAKVSRKDEGSGIFIYSLGYAHEQLMTSNDLEIFNFKNKQKRTELLDVFEKTVIRKLDASLKLKSRSL